MKKNYLYFECQNLCLSAITKLEQNFNLLRLKSPSILNECKGDIFAASAPLGYYYDKKFLDLLPNLKYVISNTTGEQHIDANYFKTVNVSIISLKNEQNFLNTITPTAEHSLGLILNLHRNTIKAINSIHESKEWDRRPYVSPYMLSNSNLGIVGYGRLGKMMYKMCQNIFKNCFYYDPFIPNNQSNNACSSLNDLLLRSDVVSIHVDLRQQSKGLVDDNFIDSLKEQAIIVNTSRGEVVKEESIIKGINDGKLRGYAADVLKDEFEPNFNLNENILFKRSLIDNRVILTPHIAGSTKDAWAMTQNKVVDELICKI